MIRWAVPRKHIPGAFSVQGLGFTGGGRGGGEREREERERERERARARERERARERDLEAREETSAAPAQAKQRGRASAKTVAKDHEGPARVVEHGALHYMQTALVHLHRRSPDSSMHRDAIAELLTHQKKSQKSGPLAYLLREVTALRYLKSL